VVQVKQTARRFRTEYEWKDGEERRNAAMPGGGNQLLPFLSKPMWWDTSFVLLYLSASGSDLIGGYFLWPEIWTGLSESSIRKVLPSPRLS